MSRIGKAFWLSKFYNSACSSNLQVCLSWFIGFVKSQQYFMILIFWVPLYIQHLLNNIQVFQHQCLEPASISSLQFLPVQKFFPVHDWLQSWCPFHSHIKASVAVIIHTLLSGFGNCDSILFGFCSNTMEHRKRTEIATIMCWSWPFSYHVDNIVVADTYKLNVLCYALLCSSHKHPNLGQMGNSREAYVYSQLLW